MKESGTSGQKEFHGCMGSILHLFDFNQARKMLPSQKFCQEVEDDCVEKTSEAEAIKCSSDNAEKKRMPNVVARLMGLDAMPNYGPKSTPKQSVGVCMLEKNPPMLSKSRSVNTLSEASLDAVDKNKLQFRSRSFREHHPQEKQLEEFKKDFEASQERRNLVQRSPDGSVFFDSQRTPRQKQKQQSKEFLDALEYLQNNDKIFLRALHDPSSMVSMQTHRPKVSVMSSSPHPIPSKNSVNPTLAKIVVVEPRNAKHSQELRGCKGEAKQSIKGSSTELRNNSVNLAKRVKNSQEKCTRKVCEEMDCSYSALSRRTASIVNMSEKRGRPLPNTSKVSSRPVVRKDSTQFGKEEINASPKEQFQCPRGSGKKKSSLKSCPVRRHNVDVSDRIAAPLTTSHSSNAKCVAGSPKKRSHLDNSISKGKLLNQNSKESTFALTDNKERRTHLTEECEKAQVVPGNHIHINSEEEIESSLEEYHVGNRLDVACNEVMGGIGGNSEFPSPVSVLDGPFRHESPIPSPVHMKEVATDFHELRTKLCSLKLHTDNSVNPDEHGQIHHEEHTFELHTDDRLLATQKEGVLEKIENYIPESLKLDDIFIPEGKEANFLYVKTVLASAGFTDNNILAFTRWYSSSHPMDPQVFYQLEECYHDFKTNSHMNFISRSQTYEKSKDEVNRKLLFELVDEVLCKKLKPFLKTRAWINQSKQNLRYMSTGNQLLKEVWDEICRCPEADCEILDDIESLVHIDMASEVPWAGDDEDIEKVGFQVEQHIFHDLIEEAILDLISA